MRSVVGDIPTADQVIAMVPTSPQGVAIGVTSELSLPSLGMMGV